MRHHPNLQENYDIFQIDLWKKLPNVKRVLWNFLEPSHLASFFFSFSFPEGEIFEDSALFVTEPFIEKKQS